MPVVVGVLVLHHPELALDAVLEAGCKVEINAPIRRHSCYPSDARSHGRFPPLYSTPFRYPIARSTNAGSTQRGGLRWIETCPPKSPKTFRISGDSTLSRLPARSLPSPLIWCAFRNIRLPAPPLT